MKKLINQILNIDFEQISELYENTKHEIEFGSSKIEPINYLEKDKIINECNLYLMNENELDYNIPEEYKRILK